jgi:hypothetical protein
MLPTQRKKYQIHAPLLTPCVTKMVQNDWVEGLYKPLDMKKVHRSPHNIPSNFREWIPTFLGEDSVSNRHHLETLSEAFDSCSS